jgi:hypothetical protein
MDDVLGMLDVTIIGWGQNALNLSSKAGHTSMYNRWWYVIPHLGVEFGETCASLFGEITETGFTTDAIKIATGVQDISGMVECAGGSTSGATSGIMRFNRRFDDSSIESQAVGAVPFNFKPGPAPLPKPTGGQSP